MKELHKVYRPKDFDEVMGQEAAVKLLEQKLKSKNFPHALLLHGPTGCGKTTIARILKSKLNVADLDFVELNASKERGIEVIRQISTSALMSSLHKGNKIYLLDECFASGTVISTDKGGVPIEKVKVGDCVYNLAGFGKVTHTFTKNIPLERLVKVTFTDGSCFYCSDRHEVFTSRGWIHAKDLVPGDLTYSKLSDMVHYSKSLKRGATNESVSGMSKTFDKETEDVLLQELSSKEQKQEARNKGKIVFTGSEGKTEQNSDSFLPNGEGESRCCGTRSGHEKGKPHVKSRDSGKDEVSEEHERNSSHMERGTRREREINRTPNPAVRDSEMAHRSGDCYRKDCIRRIPTSLQSGYRECSSESSCGNRRSWTSIEKKFTERHKKAGVAGNIGVESVAFYQRGSNDEDFLGVVGDKEKSEGFVVLYDLSVDSHPSYFAEGVAVHNCHQLTKTAQEALLKILEDTPKHVYFILATTDPQALIKAIHSRCTSVKLEALSPKQIRQLVKEIAECEEVELDDAVATKISQCADGLPREAVKLLDSVLNLPKDEALASLDSIKTSEATIKDFCQAILKGGTWKDIQIMLPSLCADPEGSRLGILGYLSAIAMKNCDGVLVELMDIFSENYYNTGRSGLIIGCWNAYKFMQSLKKK